MMRYRSEIEIATRHVVEGRRVFARQKAIVDRLVTERCDASAAEYTLALFERTLAIFEDHLRTLQTERQSTDALMRDRQEPGDKGH